MRRTYFQPELEIRKICSFEAISASGDSMSGDDNELDIGDTGWGDFGL